MAARNIEILEVQLKATGDEEADRLRKSILELAKSGDAAEEDISGFVEALDRLAKIDRALSSLTKLRSGLSETAVNLDKARTRVAELEREFDKAEEPTAKLRKELDKARASVQELVKEQNRQTAELNRNAGALAKAGIDTEKLGAAQRQVRQDITELTNRFGTYAQRVREAGAGNERLAKSTRELGDSAKTARSELDQVQLGLGKIAAAAGAAIVALKGLQFGGDLVGDAAALQTSLAEVQAIAGGTAAEFALLRDAAETASEETGIAIGDVTAGLGELARAGFDTKDTIAALRPALDLAQAGSLALSEAVEITTTTLTQFGEGADQAGRVADVLAQAANTTQSSVQGLGRSLVDVAPLARQLDISFEETVAIIGKLADEGFRGSRAGTSLRAAFSQLLDPSTKFREELAKLGITSTDFTTVLEQLSEKGIEGRNAILSLGQEAAPAILALAAKGAPAIRELTKELQESAGAAELVAAKIRDTLGNAFARLSNTAGNAINDLIDGLLKPLQGLLEDVTARLAAFANSEDFERIKAGLSTAFQEGIDLVRQLVEAADFASISAEVERFASESGTSLGELKASIDSIVAAFEAVAAAIRVIVNGVQSELAGIQREFVLFQRLAKEAELALLRYSSVFRENAEFQVKVQGEINELLRQEAVLSADRRRELGELQTASDDFADAVGRIGGEIQKTAEQGNLLRGLKTIIKGVADGFREVGTAVAEAAPEIDQLPIAVSDAATSIEASNTRAAKSFDGVGASSERVKVAVLRNYEQLTRELEARADELALQIARALEAGTDTTALQRELGEVEASLQQTGQKADQARQALTGLSDSGDRAVNSLNKITLAAKGASGSLAQVGAEAEQAFGNIGQGASKVTGGPLDSLNQKFREARERAAALGEEALKAFDATLRVGDSFKGTGFSIESFMQRSIDRTIEATRVAEDLERTYRRSADAAQSTADAANNIAKANVLSLEAQQRATLELSRQQAELEERKATAARETADGIREQVTATQALAAARADMPAERIELVARNEQTPGGGFIEISESQFDVVADKLLSRVASTRRGVLAR